MAFKCKICGKGPKSGNSVSHSHKASKRIFKPNLQKQKVVLNGIVESAYVCTSCIRSGKALRPKF
ncbi:MAG: 50S ribosomal protein L28 [Elusimicrobia bacterium]|nr:50S ribosomal protein L28 [Elusimicrobiota bacterium]